MPHLTDWTSSSQLKIFCENFLTNVLSIFYFLLLDKKRPPRFPRRSYWTIYWFIPFKIVRMYGVIIFFAARFELFVWFLYKVLDATWAWIKEIEPNNVMAEDQRETFLGVFLGCLLGRSLLIRVGGSNISNINLLAAL